ncbi:MAG: DNA primase [Rickettsiaceae bacterium 4572_127]|nr:MAG: DNA primase [Rickettsiaceae bacterium 4572_127]
MTDFSHFLDDLRARTSITSIIGKRLKLTRKGKNHWGCCPFHNEKTASFAVDENKGFYHCFGCHAHGDAITFTMKTQNLEFIDAVKQLAESAGLKLPNQPKEQREKLQVRKSLIDILETIAGFYEDELQKPTGKHALDYVLNQRNLDKETIAKFKIGYAPNSKKLYQILKKQGVTDDQLEKTGVFKKGQNGLFQYLRNRLVFPIRNYKGSVIAFSGRSLDGTEPKYLNTPETDLFHKRATFFAHFESRENCYKQNSAILTEGQIDAIMLHSAGFNTAMAPLGTAVSEYHLRILWKMADAPTLCFDGDLAGQKASIRVLERAIPLLQSGKTLRVAFMPAGKDPDDVLQAIGGRKKMQAILNSADSMMSVLWENYKKKFSLSSPHGQAKFEKTMLEAYQSVPDATLKNAMIRDVKNRLWDMFRFRKTGIEKRQLAVPISEEKKVLELLSLFPELVEKWSEQLFSIITDSDKLGNLESYPTPMSLKNSGLDKKEVEGRLEEILKHNAIKNLKIEYKELQEKFSKTSERKYYEQMQKIQEEISELI